jgi:tetratricopeptide (TPR) repeat protein
MRRIIKISALAFLGFVAAFIFKILVYPTPKFDDTTSVTVAIPFEYKNSEAEALSYKAMSLRQEGDYESAIRLFREALALDPNNPRIYFDLSDCYSRMDDLWKGVMLLDSAIAIDSSFAGFYANRGLIYYKLHYPKNAIDDLQSAIRIDPQLWTSHANIALVYFSDGNLEAACQSLRTAKTLGLDVTEPNQDELREIQSQCD